MTRQVRMLKGFSKVLDWRQLEFLSPLPRVLVCDLCGILTKRPAFPNCRHFFCAGCFNRVLQGKPPRCPLDDIELEGSVEVSYGMVVDDESMMRMTVRCPNAGHGCGHEGLLKQLEDHILGCEFNPVSCGKCGEVVAYKNIVDHHAHSCNARPNKICGDPKPENAESQPPAALDAVE
ncbi:unnamed protein product [Ixodes persulcatus]